VPRTPPPDVAGPLTDWLAPALVDWLHSRGCTGISQVEAPDAGDAVAWCAAPEPGWRVPLGDGRGSGVLLAFAREDQLGHKELEDVAALFERLHAFPLEHGAAGAVLVDHAEMRRLIHDLRNGLNTLLLNASVLARAAGHKPALLRSAGFLESAGAACADHLNRLSELTSRPQVTGQGRPLGGT
jgi:hypothetical protein